MEEPWNLKKNDARTADSLPTFIIFCEDEVSEPLYFKYFETQLIKINTVAGQKSKIENVFKAITHCVSEELMEIIDNQPVLKNDETQVWCVFDRDKEETIDKQLLGNTSFNESIETAKARGIKTAWSNDAFELWILLHFEDIEPNIENYKSRKIYYERLTEIFKAIDNPNEHLQKVLKYQQFNYKSSLKQKNNFLFIVRDTIVPNTNLAIKRAKVLEKYHANSVKPHNEKSPCTHVHYLVQELLRLGGKQLPK
ncbi:MAG: RloB family protein [Flavobacterium sp.]|nr:RloB family protein [Flavobacterium sp.]